MQQILTDHSYLALFFALLVGGETILLPAVYFALLGKLELLPVTVVAATATILSDFGWYLAGRLVPAEKIGRLPFLRRRWPQALAYASDLFKRHGAKTVFVSKFLYGTRIATQVLAGVTRLGYIRYLLANTASVLVWLGGILVLALSVGKSTDSLHVGIHRAYLLLGCFVAVLLIARFLIGHVVKRLLWIPKDAITTRRRPAGALVSAIVPALNEADTVAGVVRVLEAHPAIDDIIVVDDGSTDATAERVRETSARLICLGSNHGKATAMAKGVEMARHDTIFFLDADLVGLTLEVIDRLIDPVLCGEFDMYVAIRDRRQSFLNKIVYFSPILGGERVLKKSIWSHVPPWCVKSFQIEIALNYFSKRYGRKMGWALMPGLMHIKKEKKRGFWPGTIARVKMYSELVVISFKLYFVYSAISFFADRFFPPPVRVGQPDAG